MPKNQFIIKEDSEDVLEKKKQKAGTDDIKSNKILYVSKCAREISEWNVEKQWKIINLGLR
jgi:hypothetical protein